jgi:hypothetical protein
VRFRQAFKQLECQDCFATKEDLDALELLGFSKDLATSFGFDSNGLRVGRGEERLESYDSSNGGRVIV